jgi:hypothetical protein
MARFLPLLKRRNKENTGTAEAVKSIADETTEQLDARARYSNHKKSD